MDILAELSNFKAQNLSMLISIHWVSTELRANLNNKEQAAIFGANFNDLYMYSNLECIHKSTNIDPVTMGSMDSLESNNS